jgi:drug/metabolite transporter (DMT)-like permease
MPDESSGSSIDARGTTSYGGNFGEELRRILLLQVEPFKAVSSYLGGVVKGRAYLALAAAGTLWGTGFFFGKIALTELAVPHMVLYRLGLASCGFLPIVLVRKVRIRQRDWPGVIVAAALGVPLLFLIQFSGLARTTVSHASLMVGTMPILLGVAAVLFTHERLDIGRWLLLVLSAIGASLIVFGTRSPPAGPPPTVIGDFLVVASLGAAVGWILLCKRLVSRYPSSIVSAVVMITGTTLLGAWVLTTSGAPPIRLSGRVWFALVAQGFFATTVATLLWNWGVARVRAAEAGVFVNLEPVLGAVLGVVVLRETLGWTGLAGGALIVGAAVAMPRQAV